MKRQGFKSVGEGLYTHSNFIVDNIKLINADYQSIIKRYHYAKISKTPPYSSVEDTPEEFIDQFIVIDEETNNIADSIERKK